MVSLPTSTGRQRSYPAQWTSWTVISNLRRAPPSGATRCRRGGVRTATCCCCGCAGTSGARQRLIRWTPVDLALRHGVTYGDVPQRFSDVLSQLRPTPILAVTAKGFRAKLGHVVVVRVGQRRRDRVGQSPVVEPLLPGRVRGHPLEEVASEVR